jgi:hypothetical protein
MKELIAYSIFILWGIFVFTIDFKFKKEIKKGNDSKKNIRKKFIRKAIYGFLLMCLFYFIWLVVFTSKRFLG